MKDEYSFLQEDISERLFAALDYELRCGKHIQYQTNESFYNYLEQYYSYLKSFYLKIYKLRLEKSGSENNCYYYLTPVDESGFHSNSKHHKTLEPEYLLLALFIYKVILIDGNVDIHSIADFIDTLNEDYDEFRGLLNKKIAKNRSGKASEDTDVKLESAIKATFRRLDKLGWVKLADDHFDMLPAFGRLLDYYSEEIINQSFNKGK